MELDRLSVAQRFVQDMNEVRQRAGRPSYSTLERLSRHQLKRATMSDVLNGNRVNLPDWRFVATFVAACRAAAEESGLDANELGTTADWKRHWDGASSGVIGARFPGHLDPGHGGARDTAVTAHDPDGEQEASAAPLLAAEPRLWGPLPPRLPDFVGRQAWLGTLRQALARPDRAGVVAIQGLFGIGKTQLALEYAYRHAQDYDLVWWIPCDDGESAHGAMAELASRLGLATPAEGTYAELFELLRHDSKYGRWLLIFDNATEPEEIRELIPPLTGHVLVTTRSSRWEASGDLLELDVFDTEESIAFLRRRMRRFSASSAHRLADGVGNLPLLLEHAVESGVATGSYLARLERDPLGLLDDQPADYHGTVAGEWRSILDRLCADDTDALDLLRCLAFFGSDPVTRESLERGSYLGEVSVHDLLQDPFRRIRAIRKLRRAGLLRVAAGTGSLELHRVTRYVVRAMVASAGPGEEEQARHDVHLLVAAADPLTPGDPATWRIYEDLRGHAAESGACACSHEMVRKLVINLVRFLNAAGDPRGALSLADVSLADWDNDDDSTLTLRLAVADALFARGRYADAFALRQQVLTAMRAEPGRWTAQIMHHEATVGPHLRVTGRFSAALAADRRLVQAPRAEFGSDNPRTFATIDSLVTSLLIGGSAAEAIRTASEAYHDCLAYYCDLTHPAVLAARNVMGRCRWLAGQYAEAVAAIGGARAAANAGLLDQDHPWHLCRDIDYAVARRDWGLTPEQLPTLVDEVQEIRRRCWRTLGAEHPQTLAATVTLGSILRRVSGQARQAARLLRDAERGYQATLPEHPYSLMCTGFLATVARHAEDQRRAVLVIDDVRGRLIALVGSAHPLSLAAMAGLTNALARAGELDVALKHGQEALAGFQALFGIDHPHTLAAEANTATIASRLGRAPPPADLRTRYANTLRPGHPDLLAFSHGELIDLDFTPLPL